jgi:hypothetical protein
MAMGEVHRLLKEAGREAALRSDFDRRVVEAAAAYLASEDVEIGFLYSGWAQAARWRAGTVTLYLKLGEAAPAPPRR